MEQNTHVDQSRARKNLSPINVQRMYKQLTSVSALRDLVCSWHCPLWLQVYSFDVC